MLFEGQSTGILPSPLFELPLSPLRPHVSVIDAPQLGNLQEEVTQPIIEESLQMNPPSEENLGLEDQEEDLLEIQPESPHEKYGLNDLRSFLTPDIQDTPLDPTGNEEFIIPTPPLAEAELEANIEYDNNDGVGSLEENIPTQESGQTRVREEYEISYESEAVPKTPTPPTQSSSEEEGKRVQREIHRQSHTIYTAETSRTGTKPKRPRPQSFTCLLYTSPSPRDS